jgi:hypothetical protein
MNPNASTQARSSASTKKRTYDSFNEDTPDQYSSSELQELESQRLTLMESIVSSFSREAVDEMLIEAALKESSVMQMFIDRHCRKQVENASLGPFPTKPVSTLGASSLPPQPRSISTNKNLSPSSQHHVRFRVDTPDSDTTNSDLRETPAELESFEHNMGSPAPNSHSSTKPKLKYIRGGAGVGGRFVDVDVIEMTDRKKLRERVPRNSGVEDLMDEEMPQEAANEGAMVRRRKSNSNTRKSLTLQEKLGIIERLPPPPPSNHRHTKAVPQPIPQENTSITKNVLKKKAEAKANEAASLAAAKNTTAQFLGGGGALFGKNYDWMTSGSAKGSSGSRCLECRSTHLKCDLQQPCQRCKR